MHHHMQHAHDRDRVDVSWGLFMRATCVGDAYSMCVMMLMCV